MIEPTDEMVAAFSDADFTGTGNADWSDEHVRIGLAAVLAIRTIHRDLLYTLEQLLDLLPEERGETYRDVAQGQMPPGTGDEASWWDMNFIPAAVKVWLLDEADRQLDNMPDEEAAEWRANIRATSAGPSQRTILAARYASIWKQYGLTFAGHCIGPGQHGARCTNNVDVWVFYEICDSCKNEPTCMGHDRWCRHHAEAARDGDLAILAGDQHNRALLPIKQITPINSSPVEPVF